MKNHILKFKLYTLFIPIDIKIGYTRSLLLFLLFFSSIVFGVDITIVVPTDSFNTQGCAYNLITSKPLSNVTVVRYDNEVKPFKQVQNLLSAVLPTKQIILFVNDFQHISKSRAITYLPLNSLRIAYIVSNACIPSRSIECLNTLVDLVIVTDANIFYALQKDKTLKKPLFYLPRFKVGFERKSSFICDNVDAEKNRFLNDVQYISEEKGKDIFTFITFCKCTHDNQSLDLVKAFHKVFKDREDVQLQMIFRDWETEAVEAIISFQDKMGAENILVGHDYDFKRYMFRGDAKTAIKDKRHTTYSDVSKTACKNDDDVSRLVYINLSDGADEVTYAFDALASGIPVLMKDGLSYGMVKEVKASLVMPCWGKSKGGGNFLRCRRADIADALKDCYDHYEDFLDKVGEEQEKLLRFTKDNNMLLLNFLQPKRIVLGEKNEVTLEGITTNSKKLYKKYLSFFKLN
jgi:hypothetical protein